MPEDRLSGLPKRALSTALEKWKFEAEGWRQRKDGSKFWAHVVIDPIRDKEDELIGFAKITRDVTEKKKIEDQVSQLAHFDALTGLMNRSSFRASTERALNKGGRCVLLYLDLDRFEKPIPIDSLSVSIGVSVGMAFTQDEPFSIDILLRNADLALSAAKKEGRGIYRCYDPEMESVLQQRKSLESELRLALLRNEFSLHYQPIIHAVRSCVTGYEALIRWESPTRGKVSPAEFIPFAEKHGLILEIGDWVLRTACTEAVQWSDDRSFSINLSPAQFRSPNLVKSIANVLKTSGLPATRLELDITETAMMGDIAAAKTTLGELRTMGIMIALDDFGTGCSSLSFLHMLPFTRIKIDKSFVQDLGKTPESLAIVRAVTGLCSSLGVAVTQKVSRQMSS